MDVFKLVEDYMNRLFTGIDGMKILLVDRETSGMISLVMSQSKLFEHDVFLVDYLDNKERQPQKNLTCVCLVRPTSKNIDLLADEIRSNPNYLKYHLFFTNAVKHNQMERIAESDEHEVISDFQEIYCDFFPLNKSLFSFNEPSLKLYEGCNSNPTFSRVSEGICSYFYAYKTRPTIRYFHKSQNCTMFAKEINNIFDMNNEYFSTANTNNNNNNNNESVLLILDRKEDPITPLLSQWTYQSMIHEFFVIKNGRVKVDTANISSEYVMNFEEDSFYEHEMFSPIWKVAEKVQEMVEKYQKMTLQSKTFENIVDMKKFMQEYPEYKRLSQHVQKHVSIVSELMKMCERANLKILSEFEQEITSTNSDNSGSGSLSFIETVWLKLKVFLKDAQIPHYHKLRLCMIVLCHVGIHPQQPLDRLSSFGFSDDDIAFLKYFYLTKSTKDQRNNMNMNASTITESVKTWLNDTFNQQYPSLKNYITPLTKHIPRVFDLVDQLIRDKLSESTFPHLTHQQQRPSSSSGKRPKEIVIFMVNGATYEEARFIDFLNTFYDQTIKFTLATNFVHNNRSFISEMYDEWTHSKLFSSSTSE